MSILDDILKMVDNSDEFDDSEKKSIRASCREAWETEMGVAE
jgi:hypothetical protein